MSRALKDSDQTINSTPQLGEHVRSHRGFWKRTPPRLVDNYRIPNTVGPEMQLRLRIFLLHLLKLYHRSPQPSTGLQRKEDSCARFTSSRKLELSASLQTLSMVLAAFPCRIKKATHIHYCEPGTSINRTVQAHAAPLRRKHSSLDQGTVSLKGAISAAGAIPYRNRGT